MSGQIVYVSHLRIREGGLELVREYADEVVAFAKANEPRLIGFGVHINQDGTELHGVQVHPDSDSFEFHLQAMASQIHEAYDYFDVEDVRTELYGTPSGSLLAKLEAFPETMRVVPLHAGFVRSETA